MPDANIAIVPNGFCSESYEQNNTEDLRQKLNIDANDTVLLFAGRISPDKGCLMLMEAFNQLNKIQDNLKLVIVGDPFASKKAKKLNIRKSSGCSESYWSAMHYGGWTATRADA